MAAILMAAPLAAAPRIDDEAQTTWRQLTWGDFRGNILPGKQAASADTNIVLELRRREVEETQPGQWVVRPNGVTVFAVLNKLLSAVRPGAKDDETLAHVQLHFDIAELHARRLHSELAAAEGTGASREEAQGRLVQVVQQAHRARMQELEEMQEQYDQESKHGARKKGQDEWAEKVAAMLAAEPAYPLE